jgi:hypothetical protein
MRSFQRRFRATPPVRRQVSVFAVGRRVYVACSEDHPAPVTLTDAAGTDALTRVADGTEVEILAWRPRGSDGTRYCVRSTCNGVMGWLPVDNLRNTRAAIPVPAEAPSVPGGDSLPTVVPDEGKRRVRPRCD